MRLPNRRRLQLEVPHWGLVALLGFAGLSKMIAFARGMPMMPTIGAPQSMQWAVAGLAAISTLAELSLALALSLVVSPRRLLGLVVVVDVAWICGLIAIAAAGVQVSNCGCLGPSVRLSLLDHILLTAGTLSLCISQSRRLSWLPWRMYNMRPT
jgi:hypothetical protein